MTIAMVFDAPAPSHRDGPLTEKEAAASVRKVATTLRRLIAWNFYCAGAVGYSAGDLVALYSQEHKYTVRPRVSELKKAGLLIATGERKKNARGGSEEVLRWKDFNVTPPEANL